MEEKSKISIEEIQKELKRVKTQKTTLSLMGSVLATLIVVSAIAVLVATLWLPVLKIYGDSMFPNLKDQDYVLAIKRDSYQKGDVIAFYYNNKILVKRVVAIENEKIDIDFEGNVYVNDKQIKEDEKVIKSLSPSDIDYPHVVKENMLFVLGDNRVTSLDSRSEMIGDIEVDAVIGKLVFTIWPLSDFGKVS